jgi:hypothetical protein
LTKLEEVKWILPFFYAQKFAQTCLENNTDFRSGLAHLQIRSVAVKETNIGIASETASHRFDRLPQKSVKNQ